MGRSSGGCYCNLSRKSLGVELLVVGQFTFTVLSVLITYVLAQHYDHVQTYLPFISEAAAKGLERCIFSFTINTSAILGMFVSYVRYKQIAHLHVDCILDNTCLNKFSFLCGFLSAIGLMAVANFQVNTVYSIHLIGASTLFAFGLLYQWTQTIISCKIHKTRISKHLGLCALWQRVILSTASTVIVMLFAIAGVLKSSLLHLLPNLQGDFYLLATSCEWALVLSFLLFYLTFHNELAHVSVGVSIHKRFNSEQNIITSSFGESTPLTI